jgi:hypothetical protein
MAESRFTGTDRYVATPDLMMAVNAAVTLARPLLIESRVRSAGRRLDGRQVRAVAAGSDR